MVLNALNPWYDSIPNSNMSNTDLLNVRPTRRDSYQLDCEMECLIRKCYLPIIILSGLFLLCVPSTNKEQSYLSSNFSKGTTSSNGNMSCFSLNMTASGFFNRYCCGGNFR